MDYPGVVSGQVCSDRMDNSFRVESVSKYLSKNALLLARAEGFEPSAYGFGDRRSTS
jgi:hypothetical protein